MDARILTATSLLLFAACTVPDAAEPLPAPTPATEPAPEVIPRDSCLGCGMGYVPATGKLFLDAYSSQKA